MQRTILVIVALALATALVPTAFAAGPDGEIVCVKLRNTHAPPDTCVNWDGSVCQETAGGWECIDPTP